MTDYYCPSCAVPIGGTHEPWCDMASGIYDGKVVFKDNKEKEKSE